MFNRSWLGVLVVAITMLIATGCNDRPSGPRVYRAGDPDLANVYGSNPAPTGTNDPTDPSRAKKSG